VSSRRLLKVRAGALALISLCLTNPIEAQDKDPLPGLVARYVQQDRVSLERIVPRPDLALAPDESVHASVAPVFSARWRGKISILEAGRYRFRFDGGSLEIGGMKIEDVPVQLSAGLHELELIAERKKNTAFALRFRWSSDSFPFESVPASALFHDPDTAPRAGAVERGRALLVEYGCTACHPTKNGDIAPQRAPRLRRPSKRLRRDWLSHWLADPALVDPSTRMPKLLDAQEAADVLAFLGGAPAAIDTGVDRHAITRGRELYESIGCVACHRDPAISLEGIGSKWKKRQLAEFLLDPARVDRSGRMPSMALTKEEASQLASYLSRSRHPAHEGIQASLPAGDADRGARVVENRGCLACHEIEGVKLDNLLTAQPFERLRSDSTDGCLSVEPRAGLPRYSLSKEQRADLRVAIQSIRSDGELLQEPLNDARRRVAQLRCTSCHEHEGQGPKESLAERVPSLDGVGAKLKTEWLREVLVDGARVRESLSLRMPQFSKDHISPLVEGFARLDGLGTKDLDAPSSITKADREHGVHMLGTDTDRGGLSCISCHDVGDWRPIADEKGPQIYELTDRLRYDWFRRWMANPGRIVSGTSMPAYFLNQPHADVDLAVRRLWGALELREKMPKIDGVGEPFRVLGDDHLPIPGHDAIVQRLFLPNASPAAIAIGLPARPKTPQVSLCFDATTCHVVYSWYGGFLDLRQTLGKRAEHPKLLGMIFERRSSFPLRLGSETKPDGPGLRFRGYRMIDGTPELTYLVDGVRVREHIVVLRDGIGYEQRFRVDRVPKGSAFLAVKGAKENEQPKISSTIGDFEDGVLALPAGTNVRFDIRVQVAP